MHRIVESLALSQAQLLAHRDVLALGEEFPKIPDSSLLECNVMKYTCVYAYESCQTHPNKHLKHEMR